MLQQQQQPTAGGQSPYQQQPQQQLPNQYQQLQSLINSNQYMVQVGANNGGNIDSGDKHPRINMDYEGFLSFNEALNPEKQRILHDDLEQIAAMTLTDDEEYLYTLFMSQDYFHLPKVLFNFISSLYRQKYANLYDKYPSLHVYMINVLCNLIYNSEATLKRHCSKSSSRVPMAGNLDKFAKLIPPRKRRREQNTNTITTAAVDDNEPKAKKSSVEGEKHPFKKLTIYKKYETLLNVGRCTEYCIPAEFASLFMDVNQSLVKYHKKNGAPAITLNGLTVTFSKSPIFLIRSYMTKNWYFYALEHMDTVSDILSRMTKLTATNEAFQLGKKVNMITYPLGGNKMEKEKEQSAEFYIVALNSMSCFSLADRSFYCRGYVDEWFSYNSSDTTMTQDEFETSTRTLNDNKNRYNEIYINSLGDSDVEEE